MEQKVKRSAGRPSKQENDVRTGHVKIYGTPEQIEKIKELASLDNQSVSTFGLNRLLAQS